MLNLGTELKEKIQAKAEFSALDNFMDIETACKLSGTTDEKELFAFIKTPLENNMDLPFEFWNEFQFGKTKDMQNAVIEHANHLERLMTEAVKNAMNTERMLVIMEAARIAMADADIFDAITDKLDLMDAHMAEIRDDLQAFMDTESTSS